MNKIFKLSLTLFAIVAGTLLLMAGAGTGPRYVGRFYGNGLGLSNAVDLVAGPNINITIGPGNRSFTLESTAAGAAGIFTNSIMGYGDEYRTNYIRISPIGVTVNAGPIIADRLVILDGAASNYVAGDTTFLGSLFIAGVESSGTIFTSDVFQGNGISLTNLDGTEIRSGTVADARIASTIARDSEVTTATQNSTNAGNIAFKPANNVFTGSNYFTAPVVVNTNLVAVLFTGNGQGLTNVNLVNALSVGAIGNGVADDTAALQAAFNITTNGVWLPPGTYLITNTLVLKGFPHIVGSGIQNTFIKAGAGGADTGLEGGNMIQLATYAAGGAMNGGLLRDFSVDGSGIAANGIVVGGGAAYTNATGHMEDMEVKWCTNAGVLVLASQEFHIVNSSLSWNYNGIYSTTNTVGSDHSTTLYVDHCKIQANTNCGVYLNYAHTFRFRDNVIQGSGGPGVWFHHAGQLASWAFVDVLFSGNYFEQNNITAAYRQVGQVRMDTHATYPADKIVFENNYFNSPGGNITTNFFYIGPAYAVLRDNYFAPAWGCITVSNAATVNIMGSSVNTGNTDETGGLAGPDVYFQNSTTALPADANVSWTYIGQTNNSEKTISPKRFSTWVNNGDGHLVPASMLYGSTTGAGATAWFPSVLANGNVSAAGHILQDIGANIPTNAVPVGSASVTNWWLGAIGGIPTLVATNYAVGGWMQKALFP